MLNNYMYCLYQSKSGKRICSMAMTHCPHSSTEMSWSGSDTCKKIRTAGCKWGSSWCFLSQSDRWPRNHKGCHMCCSRSWLVGTHKNSGTSGSALRYCTRRSWNCSWFRRSSSRSGCTWRQTGKRKRIGWRCHSRIAEMHCYNLPHMSGRHRWTEPAVSMGRTWNFLESRKHSFHLLMTSSNMSKSWRNPNQLGSRMSLSDKKKSTSSPRNLLKSPRKRRLAKSMMPRIAIPSQQPDIQKDSSWRTNYHSRRNMVKCMKKRIEEQSSWC